MQLRILCSEIRALLRARTVVRLTHYTRSPAVAARDDQLLVHYERLAYSLRGELWRSRGPYRPESFLADVYLIPGPLDRVQLPEEPTIRLLGPGRENLGSRPLVVGQVMAKQRGLDLVTIAADASPPVHRVMELGLYRYEQKKRRRSRRGKGQVRLKDVRLRPVTAQHDYQTKLRHCRRFLGKGHRVRVSVLFRRREQSRVSDGEALLQRMVSDVTDCGRPAGSAELKGYRLIQEIRPLET